MTFPGTRAPIGYWGNAATWGHSLTEDQVAQFLIRDGQLAEEHVGISTLMLARSDPVRHPG
ncbi:MAG: hypothetical protein ACSLFB_12015 [Acidimicrobiales bacterium]